MVPVLNDDNICCSTTTAAVVPPNTTNVSSNNYNNNSVAPSSPETTVNILLVDDNVINQRVGKAVLTRALRKIINDLTNTNSEDEDRGATTATTCHRAASHPPINFNIDLANDGLEAIEAVSKKHYSLVFMDVHMPRCDGIEATSRIRTSWCNSNCENFNYDNNNNCNSNNNNDPAMQLANSNITSNTTSTTTTTTTTTTTPTIPTTLRRASICSSSPVSPTSSFKIFPLTTDQSQETMRRCVEVGMEDFFITKPMDVATVEQILLSSILCCTTTAAATSNNNNNNSNNSSCSKSSSLPRSSSLPSLSLCNSSSSSSASKASDNSSSSSSSSNTTAAT